MDEPIFININGYDTYYIEAKDNIGNHLLIAIPPYADKSISDICGDFVDGHLIQQIDYYTTDKIRYIKAYF